MIENNTIYWIVFPIVIIGLVVCYATGVHTSQDSAFFNGLKILSTGIGILSFTIAFVNIWKNRINSNKAKEIADEAINEAIRTNQRVNNSRADFRIELIRTCLENEQYHRCNDQFKEIKNVVNVYYDPNTRGSDNPARILIDKIDRLQNDLSMAISTKKKLKENELKIAFDLLTKIDQFISSKINE